MQPPVDLRSDTVTRPTAAMKRAMVDAPLGDDVLGDDPTVKRLEAVAAERAGKEAAVFVPSGTMANLIALCLHTRPGDAVLLEAGAHPYHYEGGGGAAVAGVQQGLRDYNPANALNAAREFFWGELCDWYLELIKPRLAAGGRSAGVARAVLAYALDQVLRLLHPFVPFITEHLWQKLEAMLPSRGLGDLAPAPSSATLIRAAWPVPVPALDDPEARGLFGLLQELTRGLREFRSSQNIPLRQALEITIEAPAEQIAALNPHMGLVANLVHLSAVHMVEKAERLPGMASKVVGGLELLVHDAIDAEEERQRLSAELKRVDKEIAICDRKLGNPSFVERAPPAVVAQQRERKAGYETERQVILEGLAALG